MEAVNGLVTEHISAYFKNLPIPKTLGGFLDLKLSEWVHLITFTGAVGFAGYVTTQGIITMLPEHIIAKLPAPCKRGKHRWMNKWIEKDRKKCTDVIDIEDIGDKASLCRCWRSAKFPYCDGAHKQFNRETGDNTGPLNIIRKKK